ncbi:replication associated protein [Microviridae sp.]|nr:replication associated protein [Microviridae sp.]
MLDSIEFIDNIHEYPLSAYLVDKHFRLYNSIRSRANALRFQLKIGTDLKRQFDASIVAKDLNKLNELLLRLDNNSLICNTARYSRVYRVFTARFPKTIEAHSMKVLGFYYPKRSTHRKNLEALERQLQFEINNGMPTDLTLDLLQDEKFKVMQYEEFMKVLKERCLEARKCELLSRLFLEMQQRVSQGWFVVFNTLTVNNDNHKEVFGDENSTAWTDYVRSISRSVGIKLYGSWRDALKARSSGEEFHSYFSVVERGSKSGRLHIHCLHFMSVLPDGCSDPNAGASVPYRREIEYLKSFWKFGDSHPIAVRFNNSDAYAKLFWLWPVQSEQVEGSNYRRPLDIPIECEAPAAVVFYVGKYLTKEYDKPIQKEVSKWRTKMNRKMGLIFPQMIVNHPQMTINHLQMILRLNNSQVFRLNKVVTLPMTLLKRLALTKILTHHCCQIRLDVYKKLQLLTPRPDLSKRLRIMIQKTWISNPVKIGDTLTRDLSSTVGSSLIAIVQEVENQIFGNMSFTSNVRGNSMEVRYV